MKTSRRGQFNIGTLIGVVVFVIVVVTVGIPVTNQAITDANLSGTTQTVVEQIPIFLAIGGLLAATAFFAFRN